MKFYLTYKYYSEYNQFEGSWDWHTDIYTNYDKAVKEREGMLESNNYSEISPILVEYVRAESGDI